MFNPFSTKSALVAEELVAEVVVAFPESSVPVSIPEDEIADYRSLAEKLGFRPTQLVLKELLAFLAENNIRVFNYAEVFAWLDNKAKEITEDQQWVWRPLRQKDEITDFSWGNYDKNGRYFHKQWVCRPYDLLVPRHALRKVEVIERRFGAEVRFFVTAFADPKADPFLMVRPAGCNSGSNAEYHLVIDVWDEPGFGEK